MPRTPTTLLTALSLTLLLVACDGGGQDPLKDGGQPPAMNDAGIDDAGVLSPASCEDGEHNGDETDVDCGGPCDGCASGAGCALGDDCASGVCGGDRKCAAPSCGDGVRNGTESDADCGGGCAPCAAGRRCDAATDCGSGVCAGGICEEASCSDGVRNGAESDRDCGGECDACANGATCSTGADCESASCKFGRCQAASCSDGLHNGSETALDCGGPSCSPCDDGLACAGASDCASGICEEGTCAAARCSDGLKNGSETDVDCGGVCGGCALGQACTTGSDCASGACFAGMCEVPMTPGLLGEYFSDYTDFVLSRVDPRIDFSWPSGAPAPGVTPDAFSVRWTGFIEVPATADYTFITRADDGARMWVNGQRIIDDWRGHAATRTEGTVTLTGGTRVPIKVEYCDIRFGGVMQLFWRTPSMAEQFVPTSAMRTDETPSGTPGPLGPYRNPLFETECADPSVLAVPGTPLKYYAVCSGGAFTLHETRNLVQWTQASATLLDASAPVAPWAQDGSQNRAPELHAFGSGFVAYYSALHTNGTQAIGAAVAGDVLGPYTHEVAPLITHPQGATDPSVFEEGGTRYLLYRVGGNAPGVAAQIFMRELSTSGLQFAAGSAPVLLFSSNAGNWEGDRLHSPRLVKRGGDYFVFYGGNDPESDLHRLGIAQATSLNGPWLKSSLPVLGNNATWRGPGSGSIVTVGTESYLLYSAWPATTAGLPDFAKGRRLLMDRIVWGGATWAAISDGTPSTVFLAPPGNE